MLIEEKRKLFDENLVLQKQADESDTKAKTAKLPLSPSPNRFLRALMAPATAVKTAAAQSAPLTEMSKTISEKARSHVATFMQVVQKGTLSTNIIETLNPLLQTLVFINKTCDFSNVIARCITEYSSVI